MKFSEAHQGRVFVIRLEQGEIFHEVLERFAREQGIMAAGLIVVGAADKESRLVVGPEKGDARPITPLEYKITETHEIAAVGTIFPDEGGNQSLHMHLAAGRNGSASVGCARSGVIVWQIAEVILFELVGTDAKRLKDQETGFELLIP